MAPAQATHGPGEMPRKSRDTAERRRIMIRMMLDIHALIRAADVPVEEALVAFAIRLGQYEGRAMDVSDIAEATRLPLSSVSRHINVLRKKGRVRSMKSGRRTLQYMPLTPEPASISRFYEAVEQAVTLAAHDVSILETSTVDKPEQF